MVVDKNGAMLVATASVVWGENLVQGGVGPIRPQKRCFLFLKRCLGLFEVVNMSKGQTVFGPKEKERVFVTTRVVNCDVTCPEKMKSARTCT